jgi:hypothetical protein
MIVSKWNSNPLSAYKAFEEAFFIILFCFISLDLLLNLNNIAFRGLASCSNVTCLLVVSLLHRSTYLPVYQCTHSSGDRFTNI